MEHPSPLPLPLMPPQPASSSSPSLRRQHQKRRRIIKQSNRHLFREMIHRRIFLLDKLLLSSLLLMIVVVLMMHHLLQLLLLSNYNSMAPLPILDRIDDESFKEESSWPHASIINHDSSSSTSRGYHWLFASAFAPPPSPPSVQLLSRSQKSNLQFMHSYYERVALLRLLEQSPQSGDGGGGDYESQFDPLQLQSGNVDTTPIAPSSSGQPLTTNNNNNNNENTNKDDNNDGISEEEQEKRNYLALAKEAHKKFFVDQISQEEYVGLALKAWNDAYYGDEYNSEYYGNNEYGEYNSDENGGEYDGGISTNDNGGILTEDNQAVNDDDDDVAGQGEKKKKKGASDNYYNSNTMYPSQSSSSQSTSSAVLKGAASSTTTTMTQTNYYSRVGTINTNVGNKEQSNQSRTDGVVGGVSKVISSSPFVAGKNNSNNSKASLLGSKAMQVQSSVGGDNSQFSTLPQQQQQLGTASPSFNKSKSPSSNIGNGSNISGGGGTKKSSSSLTMSSFPKQSETPSTTTTPSNVPMNKSVMKSAPLPLKGISKITSSATASNGELESAVSKIPSFAFMPGSSPPPLKGSTSKSSFSKLPSSPSPPPSSTNNDNDKGSDDKDSRSSNKNNPFDLFGGLGEKIFGKSKRATPSTSLIGGLGLLNKFEESDVPYGLRVGGGNKGGGADVVKSDDVVLGGRSDKVVEKGSMSSPAAAISKEKKEQMVMRQETLKGAPSPPPSFGGTTGIGSSGSSSSSSSTIGQTTKKSLIKGGQFQPSPTKKAFNTPNAVTFQKGMVGNKIGKEVLPTKKMSMPIKKMTTFATKAPLLQQPPPPPPSISTGTNSPEAKSPSSVLQSIDKNKEEIARTKSWIENETRLDDVRKKVAEIQGTKSLYRGKDMNPSAFPFVTEAKEGEVTTAKEERSETYSDVSDRSLLSEQPNAVEATNVVSDVEKAEGIALEETSSVQDISATAVKMPRKVKEEPIDAKAADATANKSHEDWVQEQNRIAQERTAERMAQEKRAREKEAAAVAAAMAQEEESRMKARADAEAKAQNDRLNEARKQAILGAQRKIAETERSRSEQIPNGQYWLVENRLTEERQKARVATDAVGGVPSKGSDGAIRSEQSIVPPKKILTPKQVDVANSGNGMPLKTDLLKGNKSSPFPIRPDVQKQPLKTDEPKVESAVPSPQSDGPKIRTTIRASDEERMIAKGFVPFTGPTTSTQERNNDAPVNIPLNAQQVVAPVIPVNKIDPSVASQMIAPAMRKKESERRSLDLAEAEAWAGSLDDIDFSSLPLIRVGNRIRSSSYGTTHQVLLILPNEDGGYEILPCIAKRPWTMAELYANVPSKVSTFEEQQSEAAFDELIPPEAWEVEYNAKSVRRYWEVEIHCNKKFQQKKELYERLQMQALNDKKQKEENGEDGDVDGGVSFAIRVAKVATPKFYDVYPDDGSGGTNEDDIIPEYGLFGQDVWNKTIEFGHDWLVYESKLEVNELTLLDAMMMQHEINKQFLEDGYQVHHLYGIQQAMKLPDAFGFGEVLDVIIRSLLENIAFLASCNVVHRKLNPSNIICDEDNGRLRIINFGDAVDLDPKETVRVGLDNDTLESNAPGSIANSLAADVFAVALVVCELLFDFDEATCTAQIKEVGYDLDAWLQRTLTAGERPLGLDEALWYLSERRGLWALLKSMIKPNPLRRKITSASLKQFNEIIALKDGKIEETDEVLAGGDESFLNSVLFPSGSINGSPGNVKIPSSGKTLDASNDDIPQTQYTSTLPRASPSSSILSELAEQVNDAADDQNQGTREEGPNSKPKMQNPAHTASSSKSDTYNDITRATFTPARTSKLTAMLAPKSRDPIAQKTQGLPEQQGGNYYDITRASFQRVSPQPMALTASQLYSILRESGAVGIPPQFDYGLTQSGYVPDRIGQSDDRGNNIVLPQRAVSANLPRGYVPVRPTESISQDAYEEVEQWLVSRLPRLQKADVSNYCWSLIDDGFDSAEMLEELEFDDLHFMKKAHQRALVKALSQEVDSGSEKVVAESNDQSFPKPKKIYKVEEALGEAARKGIEALVAASKTDNKQKPDDRQQILERYKAYEAKIAAEKAETERKIAEVENRLQAEIQAKVDEERELKEVQDRIEAELRIKAKEEQRLRELEKEVEKQRTARHVVASDEIPIDKNWIEEQNRLAEERNLARLAREGKNRQKELKGSTGNSEKKSKLADLIEKASESSFEGMLASEAEMVRTTRLSEPTEQRQIPEKEKKVNNVIPSTTEDWYAEQNRLVEERRKARLAKEGGKE